MRAHRTLPALLALVLFGLASRSAFAQSTCSVDTDCVKGWTCQVSGGSGCTAPACAPGQECEPQASDCVNVEFKSCQPAACRADSECADGMVCYTHTESNCPPIACGPGQECPAPACEPKTESACVPRYLLPCTSASDCGSGFQCESAGEQCACSGSAGGSTPASDGGTPEPIPPESSCTCEPSKELRCQAANVSCALDSDCSTGWTCAMVGATRDCASAPAPEPNSTGGAQGAAVPPPDCRVQDIKQCVPPYYALVQNLKGVARDESAGIPTSGAGDATSDNGAVAPSAQGNKDDQTASAGCSVGHGSRTGSAFALLGALGLVSALRRRRAR